ncbi:MAG: hypothetical protein ACREAE_01860 [Nitrosopumilaceae archaeon]
MFDIEANALEIKDVTKVWCIVIQDIETEEVFKYGPEEIKLALEKLNSFSRIVGHNIIFYDLCVLDKLYGYKFSGKIIDTLILSRLSNPDRTMPWGMTGQWRPHSIEVWGHRIGKPKVSWDKWDVWDDGMMERCVQDVLINTEVYKALWMEFKE